TLQTIQFGYVMDIHELREYCLSKDNCTEDTPFDETTLAFRVGCKIFALTNIEAKPTRINLKCDPERALQLRDEYPDEVLPGYRMNKQHWNTVFSEDLQYSLVSRLIDHSYDLIFASLTKKQLDTLK